MFVAGIKYTFRSIQTSGPVLYTVLDKAHLLPKMDDMLKTSDRDKNTPHSVGGFLLSTLDYTLLQVRHWN